MTWGGMHTSTWRREAVKKPEACSCQWNPVTEQEPTAQTNCPGFLNIGLHQSWQVSCRKSYPNAIRKKDQKASISALTAHCQHWQQVSGKDLDKGSSGWKITNSKKKDIRYLPLRDLLYLVLPLSDKILTGTRIFTLSLEKMAAIQDLVTAKATGNQRMEP